MCNHVLGLARSHGRLPAAPTFPSLLKMASNPLLKCQSTIEEKILVIVLSSKDSMEMMLKCRVNLPVMWFLPPPGGPMAATSSCRRGTGRRLRQELDEGCSAHYLNSLLSHKYSI